MNELNTAPATETAVVANETPEVAVPETQTETPADPAKDEGKSARDAMQRRINRLTAEKYQERAQRELTERQLREYREREKPEGQTQNAPPQIPREVIEREAAKLSESRGTLEKCNAIASQWRTESKDFESQRDALIAMAGPLVEDDGSPSALLQAAMTADAPAKVLAHLAANPDVLSGLVDLSPLQQARKIALIEQSMSKPVPKPSAAPKPLEPVTSSASSGEPDIKDTKRWIAWKNKQEARR